MKALLLFILLLCQLTTVNGQQTGCRIPVTLLSLDFGLSSTQTAQSSQPIAQGEKDTVVSSPLSVDYHINQINLADSLYKKYLPQYNYDEVKAAVEFFDSVQSSAVSCQRGGLFNKKATDGNKLIAESRLLTAAKAHYYHAVGLTERDDIVGACEHYLKALEIMDELGIRNEELGMKGKKSQGSQPIAQGTEEYEKTRFMALIYTRLGDLFCKESCYDIAIINYKKSLYFANLLNNNEYNSQIFKVLGNACQLANEKDSALCYYNKSLQITSDINNKIDIEKCIAQVLFDKGKKDTAFVLLKNNLDKITNETIKYSYHITLGNMFYLSKEYDSALYYMEESLEDSIITKRLAFTTKLSAIYDSLGNSGKKTYYDNLSKNMFVRKSNNEIDKSKYQLLYEDYNKRKREKEQIKNKARNIRIYLTTIASVLLILIFIRYSYRKQSKRYKKKLNDYQKVNNEKDEIIRMQSDKIQDLIYKKKICKTLDFQAYYNAEICKKILSKKEEKFVPLSASELSSLLDAANDNLDNIINKLRIKYPQLNNDDMYYICLIMLNISKNGISYLMNRTRKTVWERTKRIRTYMNLEDNNDLLSFLKTFR